jgi:serine protease AprX
LQRNLPVPAEFENTSAAARFGDDCDGHGTTVAGCALGALPSRSSAFQGIAPAAKLAFDDLPNYITNLYPPDDLNADLLPHAYSVGARVYSMSWSHNTIYYDTSEFEVDTFLHDHPDHVIVASG